LTHLEYIFYRGSASPLLKDYLFCFLLLIGGLILKKEGWRVIGEAYCALLVHIFVSLSERIGIGKKKKTKEKKQYRHVPPPVFYPFDEIRSSLLAFSFSK